MNTQQQYEESHKLATALLDCGWMDIDYLVEKVDILERLTGDQSYYDIIEQAKDSGYEKIDCNALIYTTIDSIAQYIYDKAQDLAVNEKEKKLIQNSKDSFSPFINSIDSWFSNEIDELDLTDTDKTLEDFAKEFITLLNNKTMGLQGSIK